MLTNSESSKTSEQCDDGTSETLQDDKTHTESEQIREEGKLPRYDKSARCMKCRDVYAASKYEEFYHDIGSGRVMLVQRIRRTCSNCSFSWFEEPLDAEDE